MLKRFPLLDPEDIDQLHSVKQGQYTRFALSLPVKQLLVLLPELQERVNLLLAQLLDPVTEHVMHLLVHGVERHLVCLETECVVKGLHDLSELLQLSERACFHLPDFLRHSILLIG